MYNLKCFQTKERNVFYVINLVQNIINLTGKEFFQATVNLSSRKAIYVNMNSNAVIKNLLIARYQPGKYFFIIQSTVFIFVMFMIKLVFFN